jgi:hypothetical protein
VIVKRLKAEVANVVAFVNRHDYQMVGLGISSLAIHSTDKLHWISSHKDRPSVHRSHASGPRRVASEDAGSALWRRAANAKQSPSGALFESWYRVRAAGIIPALIFRDRRRHGSTRALQQDFLMQHHHVEW